MNQPIYSRRSALQTLGCGFGYLALAGWPRGKRRRCRARESAGSEAAALSGAGQARHLPVHAGRGSQVDSFDYKPRSTKRTARCWLSTTSATLPTLAKSPQQRVMKPLWNFAQHGECGRWASDLFPEMQARRRPLLHPLDAHRGHGARPGDAFLHCGATTICPAVDRGVGPVRAGHARTRTCPASSRSALRRQRRPAELRQRVSPGDLSGTPIGRAGVPGARMRRSGTSQPARSTDDRGAAVRPAARSQRRADSGRSPGTANWRRSSTLRTRLADAGFRAHGARPDTANPTRPRPCMASASRRPITSAGSACWRGGSASPACASCR